MNRPLTALFAALEALLAVGVGFGAVLTPLTLMWAFQYGLAVDWVVFFRAAGVIWLLGHGVDVTFRVDPGVAVGLGLPATADPFSVTIALLGFALLTGLLGIRAGRRIAGTEHRAVGAVAGVLTVGALSVLIVMSTRSPGVLIPLWQSVAFPTALFAAGAALGWRRTVREPARSRPAVPIARMLAGLSPDARAAVGAAFTSATAASALVLAAAALLTAILLAASYANVISLYESLQAGALGGAVLTLGQVALLPNVVIWAAGWLIGPGFALGAGSAVTPLGSQLGLVPALPLFGALPPAQLSLGFLGLLVPVLAGFAAGLLVRPRIAGPVGDPGVLRRLLAAGVGAGLLTGLIFGFLAWVSGGSAGPGRLAVVGSDFVLVGLLAAGEVGGAVLLGLLAAGRRRGVPARD